MLLHVALVHEALATELAGVPRLATVHGLLVSGKLHPAVKHLTTQCADGLQTMLPPLEVLHGHCRVEELVTWETEEYVGCLVLPTTVGTSLFISASPLIPPPQ